MRNVNTKHERFEPMDEPFDMYSVSNMGYIINVDDDMIVPMQKDDSNGRLYVRLTARNSQGNQCVRVMYVAKLVADMFVPNVSNDKFVGFKDGDTLNNCYDNLFHASNMFDASETMNRPLRKELELMRHTLLCKIGHALDNEQELEAQRLGKLLWNLENDNSEEQTEYDWA